MPPHCLINFGMQKRYHNEPTFNGVYSRMNLPKIKFGAYVIHLYEYESIGDHWITLFVNGNNVIYFDSFGDEYIWKEIKTSIDNKNITKNIFRAQAFDSIMCRYFLY